MVFGRRDNGEGSGSAPISGAEVVGSRRWGLVIALAILGMLLAVLLAAWIARRPLAEHFIEQELERRGVRATYTIDRIGLHNQVISNLAIGDPARPDLTARYAQIQMRLKWNGSVQVYRIVARGVRLKGRLLNSGKVTWGDVDKLLPPPSGKPFRLPDIALDIADSAITLQTPYGRLGFALAGTGNLTGGFKGRAAAAGPQLRMGACRLDGMRASVAVAVEARRPRVRGPLTATGFACPRSRIVMAGPRVDLDSSFAEGFDQFDGRGKMAVASFQIGENGLANMIANVAFKGNAKDFGGAFNLAAQRARLATIFADRTRLEGKYRLWSARGEMAVVADYDANSASLAPAMLQGLTGPLQSMGGTPLGPIGDGIANAIKRMASGFDARGRLVLVNLRGGGGVRVESADARGPGGSRLLASGGDGINYYWPQGKLRVDSNIRMGGGGLPTGDIRLAQAALGGPISGEARFQPYAVGGARMALAPVRFGPAPGGATAVRTLAVLDGPLAGGRVTGLRIPIDGRFGAGGFVFGQSCVQAGFQSLATGALRLGPARIPVCPTGGAIVAKRGNGPLQIGAQTRNLALAGRLGKSPFRLDAAGARFSGSDRFDATNLRARFGRPEAPVIVNAARLGGRIGNGGAGGTFDNGEATIGKVPLLISKAAGKWDFRRGRLAVDGSATVSDRANPPRFYPLESRDLAFRLANDAITTTGSLHHPGSGALVTNVDIVHRLSTGEGHATLDVPGIRFTTNGLQPDNLTRLSEGVIALVNGLVSGRGRINWHGNGTVDSTGEFTTTNTDLAASFGPITGLSTTIRFTDLLALETAPGQLVTVQSINAGILVENGQIRYQLLPGQLVRIERGEWPFMGGTLILQETIINLAKNSPKRLTFEVVGLNAETFVDSLNFKDLKATGIFDGVLPLIFDDDGGRIVGGRLESREGGGTLSYNGAINRANLGFFGGLAFDALKSLGFKNMVIRVDGDLDGEFATSIIIDEVELARSTSVQRFLKNAVRKIPFKFNVTISGPFRALIATAKSIGDPRPVIRDVLPVPIDQIPGVVTEVRNRAKTGLQTQTPVDQNVTVSTKPPAKSE
jgi:translocation and assembly module TamB